MLYIEKYDLISKTVSIMTKHSSNIQNTRNNLSLGGQILACQILLNLSQNQHMTMKKATHRQNQLINISHVPYHVLQEVRDNSSNKISKQIKLVGIRICSDLVSYLCKMKQFSYDVNLESHRLTIVCDILSMLCKMNRNDDTFKVAKESTISALLNLSGNDAINLSSWCNVVNDEYINILFEIIRGFDSNLVELSEIALMILINITLRCHQESDKHAYVKNTQINCHKFIVGLTNRGLVSTLVTLCTPSETKVPMVIRYRASSLLDILVTKCKNLNQNSNKEKYEDLIPCIAKSLSCHLSRLCNGEKIVWSSPLDALNNARFVSNLGRILAHYPKETNKWMKDNPNVLKSYICSIPLPYTDKYGKITRVTICRKPAQFEEQSPLYIALSNTSFLCNILKIIISFLQLSENHWIVSTIIECLGIERLICLLVNSSGLHTSVIKNASIILAHLINGGGPSVKERCRELRGLEIMLQLTRDGVI